MLASLPVAAPAATPFAECPRCGGWARRLASRARAKCRGCRWSGLVPDAPTAG